METIGLLSVVVVFITTMTLWMVKIEHSLKELKQELEEFKYECGERQYIADNENDLH